MRVAFAPAVAGERHLHQAGVELVLQIALEDALLDQRGSARRRAFVIDVDRTAARRDGAVVDHGAKLGGDLFADAVAERRGLLAVKVAFEAMADGFVQQYSRPARAEHHVHGSRRRVFGAQVQHRLAHRFAGVALIIAAVDKEAELHPPAAAEAADLAVAVFFDDAGDVEARQRLDIADHHALRRRDEDHFVLGADGGETRFSPAGRGRG